MLDREQFGSTRAHGHPGMVDAQYDRRKGVISVYAGREIATGRKKRQGFLGPEDPPNSRLVALKDGKLDIRELDEEELMAGTTKCDDGKFSMLAAYQAATMPKRVQLRMRRELVRRAESLIEGSLLDCIRSIVEIAISPGSEDKDRFTAAKYLLERSMGKTPEVIVHSQEAPWQVVFEKIGRQADERVRAKATREVTDGKNDPIEAEIVDDRF